MTADDDFPPSWWKERWLGHPFILCDEGGHRPRWIVNPIQKRNDTQQVLCICEECEKEAWARLNEKQYAKFLEQLRDEQVVSGDINEFVFL